MSEEPPTYITTNRMLELAANIKLLIEGFEAACREVAREGGHLGSDRNVIWHCVEGEEHEGEILEAYRTLKSAFSPTESGVQRGS